MEKKLCTKNLPGNFGGVINSVDASVYQNLLQWDNDNLKINPNKYLFWK